MAQLTFVEGRRHPLISVAAALLLGGSVQACQRSRPAPLQPGQPEAARTEPPPDTRANPVGFHNPGGMWMPEQMTAHAEALSRLGLELDIEKLADPQSYPLAAVVFFGCSASFVSPDGLIITNHHCVTGALQYNSTPERDLLKDGFLAKTRADELSNGPSARIQVTRAQRDVTREVRDGLERIDDPRERYLESERRIKRLVKDCETKDSALRCQVSSFFGGARYVLIERLELRDIRLVYAPRKSIGRFGGDVDNWRWPRHSGDFAFYRAYVDKDGGAAAYSTDNVPYRPKEYLRIAGRPLKEGDLVFVAGYPGRTEQLATPEEITELVDWYFPRQIQYCTENIRVLEALGKADKDTSLKATPAVYGLNNRKKFMEGARSALTRGGAAAQKRQRHEALLERISTERDSAETSAAFDRMKALLEAKWETREADAALREMQHASSLLSSAVELLRLAKERKKPDAEREPAFQERNWDEIRDRLASLDRRYSKTLEVGRLALALERAAKNAALPKGLVEALTPPSVKDAFDGTRLNEQSTRLAWFEADLAKLEKQPDPLLRWAQKLVPLIEEAEARDEHFKGAMLLLRPTYVAALERSTDGPLAPDANATLRITYGTVRGYQALGSAAPFPAFTTLGGVVAKHTGEEPFDVPEDLKRAHAEGRFGPYLDAAFDDVPVNFVADLHITGGNSGSPTLNARGELVGLAFDGNYEAMASDWLFLPDITRSIHVDIHYALWVMDTLDGAPHLLREMGVEASTPSSPSQSL